MNQKWENLKMSKWRLKAAAFVVALAAPLVGWAQNTIQAITSSKQGNSEVVRIELAELTPDSVQRKAMNAWK